MRRTKTKKTHEPTHEPTAARSTNQSGTTTVERDSVMRNGGEEVLRQEGRRSAVSVSREGARTRGQTAGVARWRVQTSGRAAEEPSCRRTGWPVGRPAGRTQGTASSDSSSVAPPPVRACDTARTPPRDARWVPTMASPQMMRESGRMMKRTRRRRRKDWVTRIRKASSPVKQHPSCRRPRWTPRPDTGRASTCCGGRLRSDPPE